MTNNISNAYKNYNKYNSYNNCKNYTQNEKTNNSTFAFNPANEKNNKNFDSFVHEKEEKNQCGIYNLNNKDNIGCNPNQTEKNNDEKMLGAFAEASRGYDLISGKFDDYNYMIRSTKKSVIIIDPSFYESIKNDPKKIQEYSEAIGNMKMIDKMVERKAKAKGNTIVSRGWYIDKDGGISSWSIVKKSKKVKKTHLEKMRDLQRNILLKRNKKKKETQKLEEKRSREKEELLRLEGRKKAAMNEKFKRKSRKCTIIDINNLEIMRRCRQNKKGVISEYTTKI